MYSKIALANSTRVRQRWRSSSSVYRRPQNARAVQDDCLQNLKQVLPPGTVRREEIGTASGRTDIAYTPEPGMRFVIEVNRHLNNSALFILGGGWPRRLEVRGWPG